MTLRDAIIVFSRIAESDHENDLGNLVVEELLARDEELYVRVRNRLSERTQMTSEVEHAIHALDIHHGIKS